MIAARLANLRDGQRADEVAGTSIEVAATRLNVGRASVERARIVYASGDPDLVQAVKSGELSVAGAAEIAKRGLNTGVAMNGFAERGLDLYETPAPATWALLAAEKLSGMIWEPACGPGAIVRVLRAAGHRVVATDIQDYGCDDSVGGVDFLAQTYAPENVEIIVTNPPFRWADEFVRHALALAPRVVMLLRLHFLEASRGPTFSKVAGSPACMFFATVFLSIGTDGRDQTRAAIWRSRGSCGIASTAGRRPSAGFRGATKRPAMMKQARHERREHRAPPIAADRAPRRTISSRAGSLLEPGSVRRKHNEVYYHAHSTVKCNRQISGAEENLARGLVAEYLSGARVEYVLDPLDIGIGQNREVGTLWEVLPEEAVSVFVEAAFPRVIGPGKIG